MGQISQTLMDLFTNISTKVGSGNVINDLVVFLLLLGFLAFLFAIAAYRHTYNLKTPPGIERVNMIAGKVEKVEMNLNEFRIETVRNMEIFRGDLGYIKQELAQMSATLKLIAKGGTISTSEQSRAEFYAKQEEPRSELSSWPDEEDLPENPLSRDPSKKKV